MVSAWELHAPRDLGSQDVSGLDEQRMALPPGGDASCLYPRFPGNGYCWACWSLCGASECSELRAGERSEAEHSALWPHRGSPGRLQARGAASPPRSSRLAVGTSAGSSALPPPCSGWFFLGRLLGRRPEPSRGGST